VIIFRSINGWSEIYHGSQTKEQDRTSRVAWKPKKIHAKPGENRIGKSPEVVITWKCRPEQRIGQ